MANNLVDIVIVARCTHVAKNVIEKVTTVRGALTSNGAKICRIIITSSTSSTRFQFSIQAN